MATADEVDRLLSKTTLEPLTWVVAGLPVVACFSGNADIESCELLGTTTPRNDCEGNLQLWIALNQDSRNLFVTLIMRVKASVNRKLNYHPLYLVLPAEGLLLRSSVADYDTLHLPQEHFESPCDVKSLKHKMLHLNFESVLKPGYVIMQSCKNPPKRGLQSEIILHKLKHLCEARRFELYANHTHEAQQALERVSALLSSDNRPVTPDLCLHGL